MKLTKQQRRYKKRFKLLAKSNKVKAYAFLYELYKGVWSVIPSDIGVDRQKMIPVYSYKQALKSKLKFSERMNVTQKRAWIIKDSDWSFKDLDRVVEALHYDSMKPTYKNIIKLLRLQRDYFL